MAAATALPGCLRATAATAALRLNSGVSSTPIAPAPAIVERAARRRLEPSLTSGDLALQWIGRHSQRLRDLQPQVLADRDPEPLHQFRVSLRRLRSVLAQFAPALRLPARVSPRRIAILARATGQARDFDVLLESLRTDLLPGLPGVERDQLIPLQRRLQRQRRGAFAALEAELQAPRSQRLLARLERWQRQPRYAPLGLEPLAAWLPEWWMPLAAPCFLHPGWFSPDPEAPELHDLRKRIKAVRYGLESLESHLGGEASLWIQRLRRVQACLGDLHDQQVFGDLLRGQGRRGLGPLAELEGRLESRRQVQWLRWQELRRDLLAPACRRTWLTLALAEPA